MDGRVTIFDMARSRVNRVHDHKSWGGDRTRRASENASESNIADLQKMAVAEWLQSFNSVPGPKETLGIM